MMAGVQDTAAGRLSIAGVTRPRFAAASCSDVIILKQDCERTLFGIVDAGEVGQESSLRTARFLAGAHPAGDLRLLFAELLQQIRQGPGASVTLCLYEAGKLWAASLGNVELRWMGAQVTSFSTPSRGPGHVRFHVGQLAPGARIVLFSDGFSRTAAAAIDPFVDRREVCADLLGGPPGGDDATVLIADVER
jgi:hypothetical protein